MVSTLHRCPYDNSTISSVNKLKITWRFLFFPSFFPFSFFHFSFSFVLFFKFQRVVLLNFLDTNIFTERERERESPESSREGVVGCFDGAG